MKNLSYFTIIIFLFTAFNSKIFIAGQNKSDIQPGIIGTWQGVLSVSTVKLKVVINFSEDTTGNINATMDSPDQGAYGFPVDDIVFEGDSVKFSVNIAGGSYAGKYFEDSLMIKGTWSQAGQSLPLDFRKSETVEKINRPQEPEEPYPYKQEEVRFVNEADGDTLAGTLTIPDKEGTYPVVILVTGSGPQNRNEEVLGHKPFLVLSDYLTRNGIAVLRYDDRGIGESTGNYSSSTSEDFAGDAIAAVNYLKKRNKFNMIGVAGHSEGGLIAPMVAVESPDVSFVVLMAGTGLRGDEIILKQSKLISSGQGMNEAEIDSMLESSREAYDIIINESDSAATENKLRKFFEDDYVHLTVEEKAQFGDKETFVNKTLKVMLSPWFRYFIKDDPYPMLTKVDCPVLAINGEKDVQVTPKENLEAIENALKEGGNRNYKIVEMPGLNHLFQHCDTGMPDEYSKIEETFSPDAMKIIADWINDLEKK